MPMDACLAYTRAAHGDTWAHAYTHVHACSWAMGTCMRMLVAAHGLLRLPTFNTCPKGNIPCPCPFRSRAPTSMSTITVSGPPHHPISYRLVLIFYSQPPVPPQRQLPSETAMPFCSLGMVENPTGDPNASAPNLSTGLLKLFNSQPPVAPQPSCHTGAAM